MHIPGGKAIWVEGIIAGSLTLIGFTVGQGPLLALIASAVGGIGGDWVSSLAERGMSKWQSTWFSHNGALSPAIATAVQRSFNDAMHQLEQEWKQHPHYLHLQRKNSDAGNETLHLLQLLKHDISLILSGSTNIQTTLEHSEFAPLLQGDISDAAGLLTRSIQQYSLGHDVELVKFLERRLPEIWTLRFGLFLQDPGDQGTKAWRTWQRLWQASLSESLLQLRSDIGKLQHTSTQIEQMTKWLQEWTQRLDRLPEGERETTGEAETRVALGMIHQQLEGIHTYMQRTDERTARIEEYVHQILIRMSPVTGTDTQITSDKSLSDSSWGSVATTLNHGNEDALMPNGNKV